MQNRIAVIMGKVYKTINTQQLCGILEQARAHDVQVIVFTLGEEYEDRRTMQGEMNILELIQFSEFDGIIYIPYTFASPLYADYASAYLQEHATIPVVKIASEQDQFIPFWHDEQQDAFDIVRHLVEDHGCKKLHFLTGPEGSLVSQNRLAGYREAMEHAGLTMTEEDITYGDFWIYKAQELAEAFASGKRELPEAVVCGNDVMAIALCDTLMDKGINVPQDVRIIGYDGSLEAEMHSPSISTYHASWTQLGRNAVCKLYETVTGKPMEPIKSEVGVPQYCESCGCPKPEISAEMVRFNYHNVEDNYLHNNLSTQLHTANHLEDFLRHMIDNVFIFFDTTHYEKQGFYLCLCEDWNKIEMQGYSNNYRTKGYSERMTMHDGGGGRTEFSSSDMIPALLKNVQKSVIFINPVHFQECCFGYAIFQFEDLIAGYNIHYYRFLREINNGLEFLCVQNEARSLAFRNYVSNIRDALTGLYKPEGGDQLWLKCCEEADAAGELVYMVSITFCNFSRLTDTSGILASEKFLVDFADALLGCCKNGEKCIRSSEHEFLVIGKETTPFQYHAQLQKDLHARFKQMAVKMGIREVSLHSTQIVTHTLETYAEVARKAKAKLEMLIDKTYPHQNYYYDLQAIRRALYAKPEEEWTLERCANLLNVSPPYFQKLYRETFQINWIRDMKAGKLIYAASLLVTTEDKLEVIAEKCGYDYSHFMRSFKKHFGMTPKEFRKSPLKRVTVELF